MNKDQFTKLEILLKEKGYRRYNQQWHHEDYILGKSFHKDDNQWEEDRPAYQILISIYDYSIKPEYWDRMPPEMRDRVGLEVHVDMSRTIEERLEFCFAWHDDDTIENVEKLAEGYYLSMCLLLPEPREENQKKINYDPKR